VIEFMQLVGIKAEVRSDGSEANLVSIHTSDFEQQREWIERWFIPIAQEGECTYLRERPRGTGDTR
jgi:hypothetical protein